MFTFEYVLDMLTSLKNNDGKISFVFLDKWYNEYKNKYIASFPTPENALDVDKVLHGNMWNEILKAVLTSET